MGGSGGRFFYTDKEPEEIAKDIRKKEEAAQDDAHNAKVAHLIRDLLSDVNARDTDTVQRHLRTIESALHLDIDGFIDIRYAGSVSKHTYVDGLSDIDSLAVINNSELATQKPSDVKKYFYDMLCQKLPTSKVRIGDLAVTVSFSSGYEIQILPTIKTAQGIKIPSSRRDDSWSHVVKPQVFVKALRYANIQMQGKLVPVIKLAKTIISNFPEKRKLSGYHVEALAIETFLKYTGPKKPKEMLKHFFSEGSKNVLNPIRDKSGQSIHVDDHLGVSNSLERKMVSDSMATIARKMQNADGSREIRTWEQILI